VEIVNLFCLAIVMFLYDVHEDVLALTASPMVSPVLSNETLGGLPFDMSEGRFERCFGRFQGLKVSATVRRGSAYSQLMLSCPL
jgi:hypothetical protein